MVHSAIFRKMTILFLAVGFSLTGGFRLSESRATIYIDARKIQGEVSPLLFGGNVPGWDTFPTNQEVEEAIGALSPKLLRYPGGLVSDLYHWYDAVGPERQSNPSLTYYVPYRKKLCDGSFGTDEFMTRAGRLNADAIFTVNAGSGTAGEAAAWVQYCNGGADTEYGMLRMQYGHLEPYNIRFWEVGNELYGDWNPLRMDPSTYAELFTQFSQQMKQADASIKVGMIGSLRGKYSEWTQKVLEQVGNHADFLSLHYYYPREAVQYLDDDAYVKAVLACPLLIEQELAAIRNSPLMREKNLDIFISEYNTQYVQSATLPHASRETRDLKSAMSLANLLMVFMRQAVKGANIWDLYSNTDLAVLRNIDGSLKRAPTYYMLSLYMKNFGRYVLDTTYSGTFIESPHLLDSRQTLQLPTLSTFATMDDLQQNIYLMVVNNGAAQVTEKIDLRGFNAKTDKTVWTLTGPDPYATNDGSEEKVKLRIEQRRLSSQLTLPPFSVTKIKFTRNR